MYISRLWVDPGVKAFLGRGKDLANAHQAFLLATARLSALSKLMITEKGHVLTGNLRRSITVETTDVLEVMFGSHVLYAYYVEMLSDGGFLRPVLEAEMENVTQDFGVSLMALLVSGETRATGEA